MPMHWADRPRLAAHEKELFVEFLQMAGACGGDVRLQDVSAWLDMKGVQMAERQWMCEVFGSLGAVLRAKGEP